MLDLSFILAQTTQPTLPMWTVVVKDIIIELSTLVTVIALLIQQIKMRRSVNGMLEKATALNRKDARAEGVLQEKDAQHGREMDAAEHPKQ